MLGSKLKVLRSGHFSDFPDHHTSRPAAEDHLIIWVMGGAGWARIEGKDIGAPAGTLLTFEKGKPHAYGSSRDQPWDIVWTHFVGASAEPWVQELRRVGGGVAPPLGYSERLRQRFFELIEAVDTPTPEASELATTLLFGILGLMQYQLRLPRTPAVGRMDEVERVCAFVRDHLAEPISVDELADFAHLSPRQLARLMKQALGVSPMDYVIRQRISRASTLLSETALPIQQVASRVGYDDPYHFSRLFRRRTGASPTHFRARFQRDRADEPTGRSGEP